MPQSGKGEFSLTVVNKNRGFTLIELMMVVALLGVVASVATVQFASTVNRLKYGDFVRRIHSVFSKARTESIVTNSTQRVICNFGAQQIERHGQRINSSKTGYDYSLLEKLDIPLEICRIEEAGDSDTGTKASSAGAYTFSPDGLGDEFKPLGIDVIQGNALKGQLYWKVRRDSRGRVILSGPERTSER